MERLPLPEDEAARAAITEVEDRLAAASGGVFILEGYTEKQLEMPGKGGPSAEHRELFLSLEAVRREIAGLDVLIGREIERIMGEGDHHDGESAVLQLVAQKP